MRCLSFTSYPWRAAAARSVWHHLSFLRERLGLDLPLDDTKKYVMGKAKGQPVVQARVVESAFVVGILLALHRAAGPGRVYFRWHCFLASASDTFRGLILLITTGCCCMLTVFRARGECKGFGRPILGPLLLRRLRRVRLKGGSFERLEGEDEGFEGFEG